MTVEEALRTQLLTDTMLVETIDDRVVPLLAGEQPTRPHVTYTVENAEDPSPTFDGASGFTGTEVEFYVVADTYDEVLTLTADLRRILDGFGGTVGDVQIVPCRFVTQSDVEQDVLPGDAAPVYMRSIRFKVLTTTA